jgi:bifunctional ADP-heptose synthase (sugar kinase/adenylyltransferase)
MLTAERIEHILSRLPGLTIGVVGDLFLDQYLHIDNRLTEPSIETGLDAYQVVDIVNSPGAAGTVINNLVALGVGRVKVLSFIGTDGRGFDLKAELVRRGVDVSLLLETPLRRTPTYAKPMRFSSVFGPVKELNRLDIKNRTPTPPDVQTFLEDHLPGLWEEVDALLVVDQVSEADCGVVTERVLSRLSSLGEAQPDKFVLADSRERIVFFRCCWTKPNAREVAGEGGGSGEGLERAVNRLYGLTERPVFCTLGEHGIFLYDAPVNEVVPAYSVTGPLDIVGAGDSTSAGIACAYAAGASLVEAAAFGNLVASITIQQIGTTGTATPEQVRARWQEITSRQTPT